MLLDFTMNSMQLGFQFAITFRGRPKGAQGSPGRPKVSQRVAMGSQGAPKGATEISRNQVYIYGWLWRELVNKPFLNTLQHKRVYLPAPYHHRVHTFYPQGFNIAKNLFKMVYEFVTLKASKAIRQHLCHWVSSCPRRLCIIESSVRS